MPHHGIDVTEDDLRGEGGSVLDLEKTEEALCDVRRDRLGAHEASDDEERSIEGGITSSRRENHGVPLSSESRVSHAWSEVRFWVSTLDKLETRGLGGH